MRKIAILLPLLALHAADLSFDVPPTRTVISIESQPVAVTVSGRVSMAREVVALDLNADLADLQEKIGTILKAQLNQDNRCGDRLSIESAALAPDAPASLLTAGVHYEKWGCAKAFGKQIVKRLVGGDGVVRVRLTPVVETPDAVRLHAEVVGIDAGGELGELLKSGSYGAALQEKIRKKLQDDLERAANLQAALPEAVRQIAAIRTAEFANGESGRLRLRVRGEVTVPKEQAAALEEKLKAATRK